MVRVGHIFCSTVPQSVVVEILGFKRFLFVIASVYVVDSQCLIYEKTAKIVLLSITARKL